MFNLTTFKVCSLEPGIILALSLFHDFALEVKLVKLVNLRNLAVICVFVALAGCTVRELKRSAAMCEWNVQLVCL